MKFPVLPKNKNPFTRHIHIPGSHRVSRFIRILSKREQAILGFLLIILAGSALGLLWRVNYAYLETVPAHGGSLVEGVSGSPRFINPLLASSDTDRDLTSLVYAGLMRVTEDGKLTPELASSYDISEDGLTYTFTLRSDATWHDGQPVTADDIVFTIKKAQDSTLHSPKRASWDGVTVTKVDERTVEFTLQEPYAPFLENTTMGILPEHIWSQISTSQYAFSKYNQEPVGAGPYKVENINRDEGGVPESYTLTPFSQYGEGKPYINEIVFRFYSTEERLVSAFQDGPVESINAVSPDIAASLSENGNRVLTSPLPRTFGLFFNQNNAEIFTDQTLREALNHAVDKQAIIDAVLHGYGTPLSGPLPPGALGYDSALEGGEVATSTEARIREARAMLTEDGWTYNEETGKLVNDSSEEPLSFSLSTSAITELKEVANMVKTRWEELGATVDVNVFEPSNLNQNVIRPREYEALLFGEIIGRDSDPFAFWHSSQRRDPGLNIAMYANVTVDNLLEEARTTTSEEERAELYTEFEAEVRNDMPVVFLYAPDFIYILPKKIKGVNIDPVTIPSERFLNVHEWYIETDNVWTFFTNDK